MSCCLKRAERVAVVPVEQAARIWRWASSIAIKEKDVCGYRKTIRCSSNGFGKPIIRCFFKKYIEIKGYADSLLAMYFYLVEITNVEIQICGIKCRKAPAWVATLYC